MGDDDVALVHGLLHIRRTLSRSGREPVFGPPKSACRRRAVLVPQEAVLAVRDALHKKEQRLHLGSKFHDSRVAHGAAVQPVQHSEPRPPAASCAPPMPHVRLHGLRHAHATYLVAATDS